MSGEHIQSATIRPAGTVSLDCTLMNSPTLISDHITDLKSDKIICDDNDEEGSDDDRREDDNDHDHDHDDGDKGVVIVLPIVVTMMMMIIMIMKVLTMMMMIMMMTIIGSTFDTIIKHKRMCRVRFIISFMSLQIF